MKFSFGAFLSTVLFVLLLSPALSTAGDVVGYFADGQQNRELHFGSGIDGAFIDGASLPGVSVVGATISIDTNLKSIFELTRFVLSPGTTLTATGDRPLIIRARESVLIGGAIVLDGANGGNANAAVRGTGGTQGAGGGRGGDGGTTTEEGQNGTPAAGYARGGGGATNDLTQTTQRAGGGGCNGFGALSGYRFPEGGAVCPFAGIQIADALETRFFGSTSDTRAGGGGGGGGGTYSGVGLNAMNGAGGGGGGGAIVVTSFETLEFSGSISSVGGDGGDPALGNLDYGSAGGGGSGGTVWLQTASRLLGAGAISVDIGNGGLDATNFGGNGSRGVVRLDAGSLEYTGAIVPTGSADRISTVQPVTLEFGLQAGPACGRLADREGNASPGAFFLLVFGASVHHLSRRRRLSSARSTSGV